MFYPFDAFATCSALNKDFLKFIPEWSTNNSLHLNLSKSFSLIVGFSTLLSHIQSFDISLYFVPMPRSSSIKILGVHVDSSWPFESHVKCRPAYARLFCLLGHILSLYFKTLFYILYLKNTLYFIYMFFISIYQTLNTPDTVSNKLKSGGRLNNLKWGENYKSEKIY